MHDRENVIYVDTGYTGDEKWLKHGGQPETRQIEARCSNYEHLSKRSVFYKPDKIEEVKAQKRAKVEHPVGTIKHQFANVKTSFHGWKNRERLTKLLPS
ncbi:hypothetical protein IR012_00615 [Pseudomonas putida]|uniref:hypothetical protein n=1 Tax=Pseudomonas putida TaxID=303 RepID=UPI0018AA12FB|nr:hypothetical protein [Pseudomonas putida]MBF8668355.1 hypothetical protein [Pseudomonas putida]MBF8710826.1 hypothetical protein [Pseudomonas putida]